MRSRPLASPSQQLREALEATEEEHRFLNLCLVLRRQKTQETILWAGGEWDRLDHRFTDRDPDTAVIVDLEESQIEFTTWFAGWLRDFREGFPRDVSLALAGGNRRGGKTFDLIMCATATVIDVPGSIGWTVINTYRERDEIERTVKDWIPSGPRGWFHHRKAPDYSFEWANGSVTFLKSADDEENLKAGRADIVLLNEAQKLKLGTLANALGGTIDKGGIGLLAANPPRSQRGEWVLELKEAIEDGRAVGTKFFGFSAAKNRRIDQQARRRFASLLSVIDPRSGEADGEGEWRAVGDIAYRAFSREAIKPAPKLGDITGAELRRRLGRPYPQIGGVDFQATPWHAGTWLQLYFSAAGTIYHVVDELLVEGTEEDFLDVVEDRGYDPGGLTWIGDASGTWQDGAHTRGRVSFDVFRRRGWRIDPPQRKVTDKGEHPKNPYREDRVALVNNLLASGRLLIDPKCVELATALKKCELRHGKPHGRHAHITDALGYVLWWLEPRPKAKRQGGGPVAWSVPGARPTTKL